MRADAVRGRLVLDDRVASGRIAIDGDGLIAEVTLDPEPVAGTSADAATGEPYIAPGFVDVHVHGWGGHDAMGGPAALDGMARSLLRHGVTSFLPTAVTAPLDALGRFARDVRDWTPRAPSDGAEPLGFNLEGPFLAGSRHGAHDPALLREPAEVEPADLEPLLAGLRLLTLAPELRGALELTRRLRDRGTAVSIGHSEATLEQARAGYAAGATSTTHLFNAMSGLDHRAPGVTLAALLDDDAFVELIADGIHVYPALWELDHPAQAGRSPRPRQRRPLARGDRRRAWTDRRARGGRRRGPGHARGDHHARGIGHRPRHGRAGTSSRRGQRSRPPLPRRHATRWRCSGSRTAVGSPSAAARTSSSSMTTFTSAGSCAAATGSSRPPDDPGGQPTCVSERAGMGTDPGTARSARPPRMPVRALAGTPHGRRRPLVDR